MIPLNKTIVPSVATTEGDIIQNGRLVRSGSANARFVTLYFFHEDETACPTDSPAEEPTEPTATRAFAVPVEKPITRARAINAAEMEAYGLRDAMEVASFNAALARKWREHPDDMECLEHDRFIEDVKTELTAMGIV